MPLHQHATEFSPRNLLLCLALGLRSRGQGLLGLLDRYASPEAPRTPAEPGDDALIAALLGLVAFFGRLETLLQQAASQSPPVVDPPDPPKPGRGLLR